jgi:predicted nucleic acid-binding protein
MAYLPDTSVIVRLYDLNVALSDVVRNCINKLEQNGEELVIVPQVLVEFWAVATRPKSSNGLEMQTGDAEKELKNLQKLFRLLPEDEQIFDEWKTLVVQHKVSGKTTHDARIVAAMQAHKITHILTLNPGDFKRYTEISAVTPQEVLGQTN